MNDSLKLLKESGFLMLLLVVLLGLYTHMQYQQYPYCLNLCDTSIHLGMLMNDYVGNEPYQDPILKGVYSVYPWTGMFLLAKLAKIMHLDPIKLFEFAGWLVISYALLLSYFAARSFGVSGIMLALFAFLESVIMIRGQPWGILGPLVQSGTHFLTFALLAFSFAAYLRNRRAGMISLIISFLVFSQLHFFNTIYALSVLPLFFGIYYYVTREREAVIQFFIAAAYGVVSLFPTIWAWYLNGFKIQNPYVSLVGNTIFFREILGRLLSDWMSILLAVLLFIALAQYFFYFRKVGFWKERNLADLTVLAMLFAALLLGFNHLILKPTLGFDIVPKRFLESFFIFIIPLVIALSFARSKTLRLFDRIDGRIIFSFFAIALFIIVGHMWTTDINVRHGFGQKIWEFSRSDMANVTRFMFDYTNPDETIASTYAFGSVITALTGRKQIATHSEHTNIFADFDKRGLDISLLLYSSNPEIIRNVSDEYGVRYVLLHGGVGGEYQTSPKYEQVLRDNRVPYYKTNFNYGKCLERGHCPPVEIVYAGKGAISRAFISVFNESATVMYNNAKVYIYRKSAPAMNLKPKTGDVFFIHRSRRFWR